jgi:alkanesulfonate monooxygenase SsuD/methylene tetrahydromethanopterin reductase-like flavin-dependent oxidoreductase (luciferase family)
MVCDFADGATGAIAVVFLLSIKYRSSVATHLKFGLLLPHFCEHASVEKCLEGARRAEVYGFDSLWVRDHLVFKPHPIEGHDHTHVEATLLLAAIATVTKRVTLGTAMAICHRHPIHLAQSFAALSAISNGRVILGMGLGGFSREFAAAGRPTALSERAILAKMSAQICRRLWAGEKVSHAAPYFSFENISLRPAPQKAIPIWIGGGTQASCRRAVEYGSGWMPARITLATFIKRVEYLTELCRRAGKPMIEAAVMPLTTIDQNREASLRGVNLQALLDDSYNFSKWVKPSSGKFSTLDDLRGAILAGTPQDIVKESRAYERAGANHIVYDLRLRFADWYNQIELLGKEVLPALRA